MESVIIAVVIMADFWLSETNSSEKLIDVVQTILNAIHQNPKVSAAEIAMKLGVSSRAVEKRDNYSPKNFKKVSVIE